jgi:Surface glycan-binding protein B xyloglucan binding domain
MKSIHKILFIVLATAGMASFFTSCKKDENTGTPSVNYVRITRPTSSDSLLVAAGQGQLIAIVGDNLQDAVEIWFNDQQSRLTPTYITKSTILVSVPTNIPKTINNTLKIVFKNGFVLNHQFKVQISEPLVSSMVSEYVKTGEIATIRGNYFYAPVTVTFEGGVTGDIVSLKDEEIQVKVPAGALPGPIKVKTNFGETKSDFWFRDNRNLLITADPLSGWWGWDYVVNGTDPLAIDGNFLRVTKTIGAWAWTEVAGGPEADLATSHNFPDEAAVSPEKYYLKFEVNTLKPYTTNMIKIMIGQVFDPQPDFNVEPYFWRPPFDTKGQWQTVVIPFEEVSANYKLNWGVRPQGYGVRILFHGDGSLDTDIAFDNFRVVPKVSK